jgi:hypothetical protein
MPPLQAKTDPRGTSGGSVTMSPSMQVRIGSLSIIANDEGVL